MPDDKKRPLQELDFGEGLVCDPVTGICEIPTDRKPGAPPLPLDKRTTEKGDQS